MSVRLNRSLATETGRRRYPLLLWIATVMIGMVILPCQSPAQFLSSLRSPSSQLLRATPSSLAASDTVRVDSGITAVVVKSGTTALLLSAILPGAGQIYTERYWKVPVILGFGGYFIAQMIRAQDLYTTARGKYSESVEKKEFGGDGNPQYRYERDFYRDERDRFSLLLALTYLLNLVDAYVGASLYNFDVSSDLGGSVALRLGIPIH